MFPEMMTIFDVADDLTRYFATSAFDPHPATMRNNANDLFKLKKKAES